MAVFRVVNYNVCKDYNGKPVKPLLGQGKCVWHVGVSLWTDDNVLFVWKTEYEGHWKDGKMDGFGVYATLSGNKFKGEWQQDKRHGKGEFALVDGTVYRGNWVEDVLTCKEGFLSMNRIRGSIDLYPSASPYLVDQTYYEGGIEDGLMHGDGVIHLKYGRKINAHFVSGKPMNGTITLYNGEQVIIHTLNDNWEYGFNYKCTANIMLQDATSIFVQCDLENFRFELPPDDTVHVTHDKPKEDKGNLTGPFLENSLPLHKAEELKNIFCVLAWFEYHFITTHRYLKNDIYVR